MTQAWQAPFPTPYTIPYFRYTGSPTNVDEAGNEIKSWADPVDAAVQGWDLFTSQILKEHFDGENYQVYLMTPPDFWPAIQDRFGLPIPENGLVAPTAMFAADGSVAIGVFQVVGHDVENYSMTGWRPGNIILLKVAEG